MSTEKELHTRSESKCELCTATENLSVYEVPPESNGSPEQSVLLCETCKEQIEDPEKTDANHWRCLNDSMWSQVAAVQIMAWRMLTRLSSEGWPQDLLDMLYLDDDALAWAQATGEGQSDEDQVVHKDCNGAVLEAGDTVLKNTGEALFSLKEHLNEDFIAMSGDVYAEFDLGKMIQKHLQSNKIATMGLVSRSDVSKCGVAIMEGENIIGFTEKVLTMVFPGHPLK